MKIMVTPYGVVRLGKPTTPPRAPRRPSPQRIAIAAYCTVMIFIAVWSVVITMATR